MNNFDFQLFSEGGEGMGVEGASPAPEGVDGVPTPEEARDFGKEFEDLIKGDYKDAFNKKMNGIVRDRLKSTKSTVDAFNSLSPTLELLYSKYGLEAGDIEGLSKAVQADDSYFEDEAYERGLTIDQLREMKALERENEHLRREKESREEQARMDQIYQDMFNESEALKAFYPNFDLQTELQNPEFYNLVTHNTTMKAAYEVVHMDEILNGTATRAATDAQTKIAKSIASNAGRPAENGSKGSRAPSKTSIDPSKLTYEQMDQYIKMAQRGARITFKS